MANPHPSAPVSTKSSLQPGAVSAVHPQTEAAPAPEAVELAEPDFSEMSVALRSLQDAEWKLSQAMQEVEARRFAVAMRRRRLAFLEAGKPGLE